MLKKLLTLALVAVISVIGLSSCKKKTQEQAVESTDNVIVVGTNAEFAPFEYMEGDKIVGFEIDFINEIAKIIGKEIEFKNMAFDALLLAMQASKIDMIASGMTVTEERKKHILFTDTYFTAKQALITKGDSKITSFDGLENKKIGVVLGYTGDLITTEKYGKTAEITRYSGLNEAIMGISAGRVDVLVMDNAPAKKYVNMNKDKGLNMVDIDAVKEEYAFALPKGQEKLVEEINAAIKKINESGKYDELVNKYF